MHCNGFMKRLHVQILHIFFNFILSTIMNYMYTLKHKAEIITMPSLMVIYSLVWVYFLMKMNDKDDFRERLAHGKDIALLRLF